MHIDMVLEAMPKADLIFSRQALQHMNAEDNMRTLNNWITSGSTFVLQTTYDTVQHNNLVSVYDGTNSLINLQVEPYNLPKPLGVFEERKGPSFVEYLALWRLSHLYQFKTNEVATQLPFKIIILHSDGIGPLHAY